MATTSTHNYTQYEDYVRFEHRDLFNPTTAATNDHWLRAVLNPLCQPGVEKNMFPTSFGVSILGIERTKFVLKWSTCFKQFNDRLVYQGLDHPVPITTTDDVLKQIDQLSTHSDVHILVIHCLPCEESPQSVAAMNAPSSLRMEDLIDTVGLRLSVNPRLFVEHFSEGSRSSHEPAVQSLPSEKDFVHLKHPDGGYITAGSSYATNNGMTIVMDSSMMRHDNGAFLPKTRNSYTETTFYAHNSAMSPRVGIYHLKYYTEQLLRTALATCKLSHSCTDMGCLATPLTWRELKNLKQLLLTNLVELQRFLDQERGGSTPPETHSRLLLDFKIVVENVKVYEEATALQAQIQTANTAAEEARETYKQARSMERLSTLAWIFIPLSFSASFFGMNVEQLNDSGPHIGYYFVLLLFSLIISALTTLLYTNWWERIAFAWRARIEPGHDCRPRELPLAYLLWITARWLFTEMTFGRIKTRMARRRTTNTTDIELHSA